MCIIVDPPLFIPIFKVTDPLHRQYLPILKWVDNGEGKFVVGGKQYKNELSKIPSILRILSDYERRGKICRNDDETVEREEKEVRRIEPSRDFDDPHLIALVRACGCKLICVNDPRSHKYLRSLRFYRSPKDRPSLYTRPKNSSLLRSANIAPCCKNR